ncbi:MAG: methyltransferase domain-containing protein [Candidatus Magasanikbacteria bacterium]|nr:methyltransferase domain-containing protein [Candidatus Magasanikbacteria bacterium]
MGEKISGSREVGAEKEKKIIVEVGTDGKPFFLIGHRKLKPDELYISIDQDISRARATDRMAHRLNVENTMAVNADARTLPFADSTVDEMVFTNVFGEGGKTAPNYFDSMLTEAVRVLKKNGTILITETYTPSLVPDRMRVVQDVNGTFGIDESYYKTKGLEISALSFDNKDISQQHKFDLGADFFDHNFQLTLIKK